jgi:HlyD family secretion protein
MASIRNWASRIGMIAGVLFVVGSVVGTLTAGAADEPTGKAYTNAGRDVAGDTSDRRGLPPAGAISGNGIVEPADREVKLGSEVPGLIAKIDVKEGETVKAGTPLVELLADAERAEVEAAKADLDASQNRAALSAAVSARVDRLAKSGASTGDEQDRASYQAAIDKASVKQAEARLLQARATLDRLTIKAPIDGTILQMVVRAGEYYNPASGGAIATIGDLSKIRVRMDVDERQIAQVKIGQPGFVTAKAFGEVKFAGHVVEIASRMGRKNVRTDEPTERIDTKIREVVIELDDGHELVQGLRVVGTLEPDATPKS